MDVGSGLEQKDNNTALKLLETIVICVEYSLTYIPFVNPVLIVRMLSLRATLLD